MSVRVVRLSSATRPIVNRQREDEIVRIEIDIGDQVALIPDGVGTIRVKRPNGEIYPLTTMVVDGIASAILTELETEIPGDLAFEVKWNSASQKSKSPIYYGKVVKSLRENDDIPTQRPDWADDVVNATTEVHEILEGGNPGQVFTKTEYGNEWKTVDHSQLSGRDDDDQHSINAIEGLQDALDEKADTDDIPTKTSQLENDSGFITEADTVTSVNGKHGVVVLDAEDVNALPDNTFIPTKLSDLTADGRHRTVSDLDIYNWSRKQEPIGDLDDIREKVAEVDDKADYTYVQMIDEDLQEQIDAIVSKSDVVDVVATYTALLAYDTSKLGDNDVVKVLADETHDGARTYYRWSNNAWVYIGAESIGYTKAETDVLLNEKADVEDVPAKTSDLTNDSNFLSGTDVTLTQDGVAADAKAVGDAIKEVGKSGYYTVMDKLKSYTYRAYYDYIDYEYAREYFENENIAVDTGACSSVRNGNFYGRNFDLTYDNHAEFIIHTPRIDDRYESYAMSGKVDGLTQAFVDAKEYSDLYKIVPFMVVDGMNEHGLIINSNLVSYTGESYETTPTETNEVTICNMMIVRYILDHFKKAKNAVDYMREHMTITSYEPLIDKRYDLHWMIADGTDTYVIEVVDGVVEITEASYMTNFVVDGVSFNDDGTVYTPYTQDATHDAVTTNHVDELGSGLERWNFIAENYSGANTKTGMRALMNNLKYTNAYTITTPENVWYTEFVGINNLTCATPYAQFATTLTDARNAYAHRTRDNADTWQTVHSVVYDIKARKMYIVTQEDGAEYEFMIESAAITIDPTLTHEGEAADAKAVGDKFAAQSTEIDAHVENSDIHVITQEKVTWSGKQDAISDLAAIRTGAGKGATAVQPSDLADVATSGSYNDLTNKPTIPPVYDDTAVKERLSTIEGKESGWDAKQGAIGDLETIRSGAAAGATAIQSETDPTVPSWAKQSTKPTYTAEEVGALPDDTEIPTVDATLTQPGQAADAKAVGDAIAAAIADVDDLLGSGVIE